MILWLLIALMTAVAALAVLWPLVRRSAKLSSGNDLAVYRDQLDEIARDRAAGLIGEPESAAAQVEVSRRLLAAADAESAVPAVAAAPTWHRRLVAIAALVLLPAGALGLYLVVGSPSLPGEPLAERTAQAQNIQRLVAEVDQHLATNPDDLRGWELIAPVYLRLGRYDDAVKARRNVLRLAGTSAERFVDLGQALVGASNGVVTAEAKSAFEQAVALDAGNVGARYFLGLAAEQDGRPNDAASIWRAMLSTAPPGAPWAEFVRSELARVGEGPGADNQVAGNPLGVSDEQMTMIRGMVQRLSDRLEQDGSDSAGWQQLVRSYVMLGERDKARAAAADARRALAGDPDKLRQFNEQAKGLGIEEAAADQAAGSDALSDQQMAMIRGMVARLANELHQDGSDPGRWLQLVRSYMVLGERDKARAAAADARQALASEPDKLRQVNDQVKGWGIED
jgi:cytochrome c-type biogenesis protein CcmH